MAPQNFSKVCENQKNLEFRTQVNSGFPKSSLFNETPAYDDANSAIDRHYNVNYENIPKVWLG